MLSVLALLCTVAVSTPSGADVPPAGETIVVTATRSERNVSELPVSTTVVRKEEIESAPVRSVDDLLRGIAGVTPSVISASGSTPNNQRFSMHGLGGTRALVLLDGIPIHDPYSGIVQWQTVPLQSLRQIEVVRGGNASLFGNFALGGTINLITPPVQRDDLALDLSWGTGNTAHGALTLDHAVTDKLAVRVSRYQTSSDGFVRVPDPGPIDIPAWLDNVMTAARVEYAFSERGSAFVNASTSQIDISQGTPTTYSKRDINAFSGGMQHAIGANALVIARAYTQRQSERLVNSSLIGNRVSEWVSQDGTNPSTGSGASAEWTLQRSGPLAFVSVGVDLQRLEANEVRTVFDRSGAVTQHERVGGRQRFAGLFAQASWRPSARVEVLGSARMDWFRNEHGYDDIAEGASVDYPSRSTTELDPRLSVRYAMGGHAALRGSVYRAFNAPTLRDLYRNNQSGNSIILGNPALTPETLVGGEIGWEWASDKARVEMNVYRSTISGMQSRALLPGQKNVYQYLNLGSGRSQGVELMSDVRLSRRWQINAGYTFADAVITSDPTPSIVGNELPEVPRHAGSVSVRFRADRGTTAVVRGTIMSRSYGDVTNTAVSNAHHVIDVSLSQPLRSWMDVYALVENALDEDYYLALTATSLRSGLPRTVTGGIRISGMPWRAH